MYITITIISETHCYTELSDYTILNEIEKANSNVSLLSHLQIIGTCELKSLFEAGTYQ